MEVVILNLLKPFNNIFFKYNSLLQELVVRDIKIRYRKSVLGVLWTVLNPLLNMLVMTAVFQTIFASTIEFFALYVMIGNVVFGFVNEATTRGMNSILWNASLIKKVYIPKYLFPLANVLSSVINFLFSYVAMILVMIVIDAPFRWLMLTSIVPFIYLIIFSYGMSLLLCSINVFFRDIQHLYTVFLTIWMYMSAIFYSVEDIAASEQGAVIAKIINCNPLYQYIRFFREIIIDGTFPGMYHNLFCGGVALLMLAVGSLVFWRAQRRFILHI